ncbi:MAG: CoA pyrophosphatase [Caulobacteraceae bacterium]
MTPAEASSDPPTRATPASPVEVLEPWIRARLRSIEGYDPSTVALAKDELNGADAWQLPPGPLRPAAVLAPLIEREEGLTVLLTRRSDALKRHSGQIALPGGRCDPGETPWDTAMREAEEEVGLDRRYLRLAGLGDTYEIGTGFSVTLVVAFVSPGFTLTPDPGEVAEVFETPFRHLMDPENHQHHSREFADGRTRRFYAIPHEERMIWGATAWMLRGLYKRLFEEG